jgi:ribose 5-phosphate isomerase B
MMKISIGSDHAGYKLKMHLISFLGKNGFEVFDFGASGSDSCDYPEFAEKVAISVATKISDLGILICGSGVGMSIAANKIPGIRAALVCDKERAELARKHNDANILCIGAKFITLEDSERITLAFLNSEFEGKAAGGERHSMRVKMIVSLDEKYRNLEATK